MRISLFFQYKIAFVAFAALPILLYSQNPYPSVSKVNYVRTWDVLKPVTDASNLIVSNTLQEALITTQYLDGLGRPLQTVIKQGSLVTGSAPTDLVNPVLYDEFGRVQLEYLPFAANNTGGNASLDDGKFKFNPFQQQGVFMQAQYNAQGETYFYGKKVFDASPLNRITKIMSAGNSWVGSNRGVENNYWTNTVIDNVKKWQVTDVAGGFGSYMVNGAYPVGELYKNVTVDEQGKQSIEFKDKGGKIILKKQQLTAASDDGSGSDYPGWLCTYYIYDNLDNIRCVVQPKAVEMILPNWSLSSDMLNELCFRYEYDERRRMIMKKTPGAAETYMVYDSRDRIILVQDGNLRAASSKWVFTKYDALDRPIVTGFYIGPSGYSQQQMDQLVKTSGLGLYEERNSSTFVGYTLNLSFPQLTTTTDVIRIVYYDDYSWIGWYGPQYASKDNNFDNLFSTNYNSHPYPEPLAQSSNARGLVTGMWNKMLITANFYDDKGRVIQTKTSNLFNGYDIATTQYSFSGRILQTVLYHDKPGTNPQNHQVITNMDYDGLGRLSSIKKTINSTINGQSITKPQLETVVHTYDALGRLKTKKLGKKLNQGVYTSDPIETLEYDYNIRSWSLGMNRNYAKTVSSTNKLFGYDLAYDKLTIQPDGGSAIGNFDQSMYSGIVAGVVWKSTGDDMIRRYDFTYDAVNRLTNANFKEYSGSQFGITNIDFSVSNLSYDANGNILTMQQKGWKITGNTTIDNLKYHYALQGLSNRLQNVIDMNNDPNTVLGDFRTSIGHSQRLTKDAYVSNPSSTDPYTITDYMYDGNGNINKDFNKDIGTTANSGMAYNHLNLLQTALFRRTNGSVKGAVNYTYTSDGIKLRKTVHDYEVPNKDYVVTTTNYANGFEYQSRYFVANGVTTVEYTDVLQFIGHEEGRVRLEKATSATCPAQPDRFLFDYFVKDHLGNVRMVLTEQDEKICYIAATIEDARRTDELKIYDIQTAQVTDANLVNGATSEMESKVYKVQGVTGQNIGLGMVLKVMAGDVVKITGESVYELPPGGAGNPVTMTAAELIAALAGTTFMTGKGVSATSITNAQGGGNGILNFINNNPAPTDRAKAFINWVLFDEQFKFVAGDVDPVKDNGGHLTHNKFINNPVSISKHGYLYVYVSNESNLPVYFDNLLVTHMPGPIAEETHHYPFGLTMAGISTKAAGVLPNREQTFQEQRFDQDHGLNLLQFKWRSYDLQIGRFLQIDPLADNYRYQSPYNFSENRVTDGRELEGLEYVTMHHYADGKTRIEEHYMASDAEINRMGGTTAGLYNAASYGPLGKGVRHIYYDANDIPDPAQERWDNRREDFASRIGNHGLYSGPGCITDRRGRDDFSFRPIDWADAIAKRHDEDYKDATATGAEYSNYLEDVRTLQADLDMIERVDNILSDIDQLFRRNFVGGVDIPYRRSSSGEMRVALHGQKLVIGALAKYKQWKIDKKYSEKTWDELREEFAEFDAFTAAIIDQVRPSTTGTK